MSLPAFIHDAVLAWILAPVSPVDRNAQRQFCGRRCQWALAILLPLGFLGSAAAAAPLTTLEYRITGSVMRVSPAVLSVPKGIAGSVAVEIVGDAATVREAFVSATLRGPSFEAREIFAAPGQPLVLPPLNVVGDYQLANVRLVDSATQATRLEGSPSSVPVHVFDEVLVSRVTSRPLTGDEIKEKGIFIDEQNFRVTEFEVGFVLDGKTIPVRLPVVSPRANQTTEIIPAAELEERLKAAQQINQDLAAQLQLPDAVKVASIELQPVNFQFTEETEQELGLSIPPIPALLVIPGNIGFLNQFFSVQVFTENAAPAGSGLSVLNVQAELVLPPGDDKIPSPDFNQPGDDPLRFARIGAAQQIRPSQPIVRPGADGKLGTPDDIGRLTPGEGGQAEFLVEGLQEGLHVMNLKLTADLEGLAAGVIRINGKAAGSVLVRNPKFSIAFTHPRTVRTQEPYDASVTILNTGSGVANFVRVTLPAAALSGAALESDATVELGTIPPGQSATARWKLRAQRTGQITFSNLTFGEDATAGRFILSMGVDENGVALSPDSLGFPDDVALLPERVRNAADRVLGQALSAATAPLLPAGVLPVSKAHVKDRVLELAEAGQRLRYGDDTNRVLLDLLLDWQGARRFTAGFDQILRENDAGTEWRDAIFGELLLADGRNVPDLLSAFAPELAGRTEPMQLLADNFGTDVGRDWLTTGLVTLAGSAVPRTLGYGETSGALFVQEGELATGTNAWRFTNPVPAGVVRLLRLGSTGTGSEFSWLTPALDAGSRAELDFASEPPVLRLDRDGDGVPDETLAATRREILEAAPRVIGVIQDPTVLAGRPAIPCTGDLRVLNYGTVIGVLFSKPLTQDSINRPAAYVLDDGNTASTVQIQGGGRLALLNLRRGISAVRPRSLTVQGVADERGNLIASAPRAIRHELLGNSFADGIAINGRVLRGDGSPAVGVPVTLTMNDQALAGDSCVPHIFRPSQVFTDANGDFTFDFVLAGPNFTVSATDTAGLSSEALAVLLSSGDDTAQLRTRLTELAEQNQGSILDAFAAGALPEAIAKAEGLDRALFRDTASPGRTGGTNFVALRFRGRGTVTGTVLGADATTPVAGAAVNLFPDPNSRELGRGVFSDSGGRFAFFGVPLGSFSVQVDTGAGLTRSVSESLATPGELKDVPVVLSAAPVARGSVVGRVTEADLATVHPGAQVFVLDKTTVLATATSDANGDFTLGNVPVGLWTLIAISQDGRRATPEGFTVTVTAGQATRANLALPGFASVAGRVRTSFGVPMANALVAGGINLVTSDADGRFLIPDVPTGQRSFMAAVTPERNPLVKFQRTGSASLLVLPGIVNVLDIVLAPAGAIQGTVRDEEGRPVPNVRVARPVDDPSGFFWVVSDANGFYRFENIEPGPHVISAPSGPVDDTDVSGVLNTLGNDPNEGQLGAALQKAFAIFTGASNPLLNGEGGKFRPDSWGYINADVRFDGDVVVQDVQFFRKGTVTGQVLNGQDVPISAKVRLTGLLPANNGAPMLRVLGDQNSDPATGEFAFPDSVFFGSPGKPRTGQVTPGTFGLQAASPFFPVVLSEGGLLTELITSAHRIMKFPPPREISGQIAGQVFNPDGGPAAEGVRILVPAGRHIRPDLSRGFVPEESQTGKTYSQQVGALITAGVKAVPPNFPPTVKIPAGEQYDVVAFDPTTGLLGFSKVFVNAGETNNVVVRLLGKGGARVLVVFADGSPAAGADVILEGSAFPFGEFTGRSDAAGLVELSNLTENDYAVRATTQVGAVQISGRAAVRVPRAGVGEATVRLQPTASIAGRFVRRDLTTPIVGAQINVGGIAFAGTDGDGAFLVTGLPLGTYRVTSSDPVSGVGALANVTLAVNGETNRLTLIEQALGEITGRVLDSFGTGVVPGAEVTIRFDDGLNPERTVTTDPTGRFRFPASPAGGFQISARDPQSPGLNASRNGTLPDNVATLDFDVALTPLGNVLVRVRQPDGLPAVGALVTVPGAGERPAEADGSVRFAGLPLGTRRIIARDGLLERSRSVAQGDAQLTTAGQTAEVELTLSGVGEISGRAFQSDGTTPVPAGSIVTLLGSRLVEEPPPANAQTGSDGNFRFGNVGLGDNRLTLKSGGLSASATVRLVSNGQSVTQDLELVASGSVIGRVLRADGLPAADVGVVVQFGNRGGTTDRAAGFTGVDGRFRFEDVPLGLALPVEAVAVNFDGFARSEFSLTLNGQEADLGDLTLDESPPAVVRSVPAAGELEVSTTAPIDLIFSEAIDPVSIDDGGIFLRRDTDAIPITVTLLDAPEGAGRRLRITPVQPLRSQQLYTVLMVSELPGATGGSAFGPRDLAGRLLARSFTLSFTTADNNPPVLLSSFPAAGETQVDPRSVLRFAFNETLRPGAAVTLAGPVGPITGTSDLVFGGQAVTFTPLAALPLNARFTATLNGVLDLAGNAAAGQPLTLTFNTLDTLGPEIATLRIGGGVAPVAGRTIEVEAVPAAVEAGMRVRFVRDLTSVLGTDSSSPFRVSLTLPESGGVRVDAIASDRFNNEGTAAVLEINTVANEAPVVELVRLEPVTGPAPAGSTLRLRVSATDDVQVTNLTVVVSGFASFTSTFANGAQREISVPIPVELPDDASVTFTATARDFRGVESAPVVVEVPLIRRPLPLLSVVTNELELPETLVTNLVVTATHADGGLAQLELLGANFATLVWTNNGTTNLTFTPAIGETNAVLQVAAVTAGTNEFAIRATATNGLTATLFVRIIGLADLDRDGTPDRIDTDLDGDGLPNDREVTLGTDPRKPDTDGDTLTDGAEVAAGTDPTKADTDDDGLADNVDPRPTEPNLAPVAGNDTLLARRDGSVEFAKATLLANDSDPENEGVAFVSFTAPANGTLIEVSPTGLRYTPTPDFSGDDAFTYTVRDPLGLTATATVAVSVAANRPPVATPAEFSLTQGGAEFFLPTGTDPDGDALTLAITRLPTHGKLFQVTGTLSPQRGDEITAVPATVSNPVHGVQYVPEPVFFGSDTFAFRVNDGELDSAPGEVRVTVTEDPLADTDGDGIPNRYELANGLDPLVNDAGGDLDGDLLTNFREFELGTAANDADTDDDGLSDAFDPRPLVSDATAISGLFDTGTDAVRSPLPDSSAEPHYFFLANPDGPATTPVVHRGDIFPIASGPWLANSDRSKWIAPRPDTGSAATGSYRYVLEFVLPEFVPGTVTVEGRWASDNAGVLLVNDTHPAGVDSASFTGFTPFRLTSGFVVGVNRIEFRVDNGGGPTGLLVDGLVGRFVPLSLLAGRDADGDGLPDLYELANGLNPQVADADGDLDGDTLTNRGEFDLGTAPNRADTDNDGLRDDAEIAATTNPLNPDTDGDGILDGQDPNPLQSDADLDGDGIADVLDDDMDGDGLDNEDELTGKLGVVTDPRRRDTDGDRWPDGLEVEAGSNPLSAASVPELFQVGEPAVGIVLPVVPASAINGGGLTVSFPEASVVLAVTPATALNGSGFTVSFPEVSLVLPVTPATALNGSGFTVSFPEASLVLPVTPASALSGSGFTVGYPEVFLRLEVPVTPPNPDGGGGGSPSGGVGSGGTDVLSLRLVEIQLPSAAARSGAQLAAVPHWWVLLEWQGSADARYVIEASPNLTEWTPVPAESLSAADGSFRARCETAQAAAFYRVRQLP